jgi:threonylcarbamoyladenosine tRNA methylthiotransferase MtaB
MLRRLSQKKRFEFDTSFQRQVRPVLFEEPKSNSIMYGWTDNYVRVGISANKQYKNKILPVELGARTNSDYMIGTLPPQTEQEEQIIAELVH